MFSIFRKALHPEQYQKLGLWTASLLTACMGLVNLFSAVTPSLPERLEWVREIFPFHVRASGHVFAALSGFFLLLLAANLLRRKRVAWILTIALLITSVVSHLVKGWDYEEVLLASVLLVQLLWMRKTFTARSDPPSIGQGLRVLIGALLFTLAYGTLGFYLHDRAYNMQFDLPKAMVQTLAMFFTEDNAGLVPRTRYGQFFVNSIYLVGGITLTTALWMLLRPVLLRGHPATTAEYQHATEIVEAYGSSSLARFTLLEDKSYYFSPSGQTAIAYVPKGRGAIALGDPIGPEGDRKEAILGFQEFCRQNDWQPAFYQTLPDDLNLYRTLGFHTLQIGEEGVVDLVAFSLKGKAKQDLRTSLNKFKRLGYEAKFYDPPISSDLIHQLREISNEWLAMMEGAEKRFSLGWFHDDYLQGCNIVTVVDASGQIIAFANVVNAYQSKDVTVDLMRRRSEVPPGTMDFLFVAMFEHFKAQGYEGFNIGLSALSGVGEVPESRRLERGVKYLYQHLNRFYNFKGIHNYKEKFQPRWEPRYLVYPSVVELPTVVMALIRADSGDRLLDYLRPGE
jgi:phosphatidylglycerol lysyltransferase